MSTRPPILDMAKTIVLNAKMRRTGVCGAAETLLVDRAAAATHLKPLVDDADRRRLRGARRRRGAAAPIARVKPATEADWSTEYLDAIIAAKVVDGVDARDRRISSATARTTPTRSSPTTRRRPRTSSTRSTPRSCCTTPRRSSPTAASSASAPRSASPPAAACARPGRRRAAHQLQIPRPRHRPDHGREHAAMIRRVRHASSCRRMRPACGSACSAARSIRRMTAHRARACSRMKRLRLDRVWWLVTPGNPLKDTRGLRAARRAHRRRARARRTIRASTSPASRPSSARATPTTRWRFCCAAARACSSSGSWAPTTCGSFHRWQKLARHRSRCMPDRGRRPRRARASTRRRLAGRPGALARYRHPRAAGADAGRRAARRPGSICTG